MPLKTLFLNPPSFENFDGGAGSRWPATREIESYWYPVWLCYPAGMLPDSKVVDAPPHKVSIEQTIEMAKDFELLVVPGMDHGSGGAYGDHKRYDFFVRYLLGAEPPKEYQIGAGRRAPQ